MPEHTIFPPPEKRSLGLLTSVRTRSSRSLTTVAKSRPQHTVKTRKTEKDPSLDITLQHTYTLSWLSQDYRSSTPCGLIHRLRLPIHSNVPMYSLPAAKPRSRHTTDLFLEDYAQKHAQFPPSLRSTTLSTQKMANHGNELGETKKERSRSKRPSIVNPMNHFCFSKKKKERKMIELNEMQ